LTNKFEAVIVSKREWQSKDDAGNPTTLMAKLEIMEVDTLLSDVIYTPADRVTAIEADPTKIVEIQMHGTHAHPKVKSVTQTTRTLKISSK